MNSGFHCFHHKSLFLFRKDFLPMSFDLATIREDLILDESLDSLKKKQPKSLKLIDVFKELEFKNWAEELPEVNEGE